MEATQSYLVQTVLCSVSSLNQNDQKKAAGLLPYHILDWYDWLFDTTLNGYKYL